MRGKESGTPPCHGPLGRVGGGHARAPARRARGRPSFAGSGRPGARLGHGRRRERPSTMSRPSTAAGCPTAAGPSSTDARGSALARLPAQARQ